MDNPSNQRDTSVGKGMLWMAAVVLLGGLTLFFQVLMPERGGIVSTGTENGRAMVVLQQDATGHYLAEGAINGQAVAFLVDTGATSVAVSERMARALGLEFGPRVQVMTAAGPANAWMTRLDSVTIGVLSLANVRATITPALGEEALLGMSFLKHFSLEQRGDQLIISAEEGQGA